MWEAYWPREWWVQSWGTGAHLAGSQSSCHRQRTRVPVSVVRLGLGFSQVLWKPLGETAFHFSWYLATLPYPRSGVCVPPTHTHTHSVRQLWSVECQQLRRRQGLHGTHVGSPAAAAALVTGHQKSLSGSASVRPTGHKKPVLKPEARSTAAQLTCGRKEGTLSTWWRLGVRLPAAAAGLFPGRSGRGTVASSARDMKCPH